MTHIINPSRRKALFTLGAGTAGLFACPLASALALQNDPAIQKKRLILFRLYGGNDGLNTLVPYRDPLYRNLRPTLALNTQSLLPVSHDLAFNPRLTELMKMFQAGEVAIIQDVGYPDPNLSHFESAIVWDTAQPKRALRSNNGNSGWYGEVVMHNRQAFNAAAFDAAAISFDKSTGFANGTDVPVLMAGKNVFETPKRTVPRLLDLSHNSSEAALKLGRMINEGYDVQARFAARLKGVALPQWKPYEEPLDVQTGLTDWFIAHQVKTPVIRLYQDGYDTHSGLLERHDELLANFDASLAKLRQSAKSTGTWNDTVIMVHSEFGRRAEENGYGGTDHGTAGPVFLIGGKVKGGLYGQRAALDALDGEGNLKYTTDFRRVYSTVVGNLWDLPSNPLAADGHMPLPIALA